MSTTEDFENAPVGATARNPYGWTAVKVPHKEWPWSMFDGDGDRVNAGDNDHLMLFSYTLDPLPPTTAREALELAWELAHEMKEGHDVPIGTECIAKVRDGEFMTYRSLKPFDGVSRPGWAEARTLDPLPDPEPDWLDAPAVLATCGCRGIELWHPRNEKDGMWVSASGEQVLWSTLRDVTPLYPKGQDA